MKCFVGAYATAPSTNNWDENQESSFYQKLKEISNINGLEHPFVGKLHPFDDDWFLNNIDKNWEFIFTSIPGVMAKLTENPHFGIASTNTEGREQALSFYRQGLAAIKKLHQYLGRNAVTHLKIHTAPRAYKNNTSREALISSLAIMQSWQWCGTQLVIEHCDAYNNDQPLQKGFLTLTDEIAAISHVNQAYQCNIGLSINWGRSAIETQSVEGPISHIQQAKQSGLLTGIIFSGVTKHCPHYGHWQDTHAPATSETPSEFNAPNSQLTLTQMKRSMAIANAQALDFYGCKISLSPNHHNVDARINYIKHMLQLLEKSI